MMGRGEDEEDEDEDDEFDGRGEEEEELIEPGHEEQFVPQSRPTSLDRTQPQVVEDEGLEASRRSDEEDEGEEEEDLASNEGDLEIAETSADSGINSSLDVTNPTH